MYIQYMCNRSFDYTAAWLYRNIAFFSSCVHQFPAPNQLSYLHLPGRWSLFSFLFVNLTACPFAFLYLSLLALYFSCQVMKKQNKNVNILQYVL